MSNTTRRYPGSEAVVGRTVAESNSWWPEEVRPSAGAPNVVIVLMDDMGFSDIGPFGAEIPTPTLERLAQRGLRYLNYHTAPLCSPARAALLTGRNSHRAGFANVANFDPGFPGWTMEIADGVPTLASHLRDAGYATFCVGKWHLTRDGAMHDGAPKYSWPLQRGFDRFYGILDAFTNLHHPHRLVRDNTPVDVDEYPDSYYFTDDITDEAIRYLKTLRAHDGDRPFFLYIAHGAVHGPLHAKADDMARHRGHYDAGWDALREARFTRQKQLGLFPPDTPLPPPNHETAHDVPDWDSFDADDQSLFPRYMEAYAAMIDNVDQNLGRLVDTLAALGDLDNTIIVFTSDNGATEEGGQRGTRGYFKSFSTRPGAGKSGVDVPRDPDLIGGPQTLVHYPKGWGMASNTPFRLYKATTHAGGVRVPCVISWPSGIPHDQQGGLRRQFQYVTDLFPTILDAAGLAPLDNVDGTSFAPSLHDPELGSTHREQYSECFGNRSFYRDGWKLVALHQRGQPYDDREWELYDIAADPTEVHDRAAEFPELVAELSAAWEAAAWDNQVFPLDDGTGLLQVLRRPDDARLHDPVTLLPGTPTLERFRSQQLIAFRSFRIEIDLDHRDTDAGVLVAHGDQGGGYSVYVDTDGVLRFAYNCYGELTIVDAHVVPAGEHRVTLEAVAVEQHAWDFTVLVDGEARANLRDAPMLMGFAPFQGIDVGVDRRSPVVWAIHEQHGSFPYSGTIATVTYRPGEAAPYDPQGLVDQMRQAGLRGQ